MFERMLLWLMSLAHRVGQVELLTRKRGGRDLLYLERAMLFPRNKFFNVFLHRFWDSDAEGLHDHPCDWLLIGLKGWYVEQTFRGPFTRSAGEVRVMTAEHFHRVLVPKTQAGDVWTLALRGPNRKWWGFLPNGTHKTWERWNDSRKVTA